MPRDRSRGSTDAGFRVDATLGDYQGGPWDPRADVWLLLARRGPERPRRIAEGRAKITGRF